MGTAQSQCAEAEPMYQIKEIANAKMRTRQMVCQFNMLSTLLFTFSTVVYVCYSNVAFSVLPVNAITLAFAFRTTLVSRTVGKESLVKVG